MKIKPEHFKVLLDSINALVITGKTVGIYEKCRTDPKVKDIQEAFRWDCFWTSVNCRPAGFTREIYEYLNDKNIDTALKKVVEDLQIS